jgi:hypothetical protein
VCAVGSGSLWHLPQEFSKIVFPRAICSAVETAGPIGPAVEAFGVQEASNRQVNNAAADIFFMFLEF